MPIRTRYHKGLRKPYHSLLRLIRRGRRLVPTAFQDHARAPLFDSLEPRLLLAADLVVTSVSDTDAFYNTGNFLHAQAHIANQGSFLSNTGPFDLQFWLSRDGVTSKFRFIESGRVLNVLAGVPTSDIINAPGWRIPTDIPQGRYHVTVYLDTGNDVAEENEGNNVGVSPSFTIGQPDLEVPRVDVSGNEFGHGDFLQAEATIANTGLGSTFPQAPLGFNLRFFLGNVDGSNRTQFSIDEGFVSFLNGGQSTTDIINTLGWRIPSDVPAGQYRVWVNADSGGDVVESDEGNNWGSSQVIRIGLPDLQVESVELANMSGVYSYNDLLSAVATIRNAGPESTFTQAPLGFNVSFHLGATVPQSDADRMQYDLQEAFIAFIGGGGTRTDNLNKLLLPANFQPGEYRLWVKADSGNDVIESNENNNWASSGVITLQGARWETEEGRLLGPFDPSFGAVTIIPEATPVYLAIYSDQVPTNADIGVNIFEDDVVGNDLLESVDLEHVASLGGHKWQRRWIPYRTNDLLLGAGGDPEYFFRVQDSGDLPGLFDASSNLTVAPNPDEFGVLLVEHTVGTGVPLVLVHGNNSDLAFDLYRWKGFLNWIEDHPADYAQFDVYLWKHDTSVAVGFNGGADSQADKLADFIYGTLGVGQAGTPYENQKVALVGHSQGGMVSRSFLNTFNPQRGHKQGEDVSTLITIDTPHHGSPFGIEDWVAVLWSQQFGDGLLGEAGFNALRDSYLERDDGDLNLAWSNQDGVVQNAISAFSGWIGAYVLTPRDTNRLSGFPDPTVVYRDSLKQQYGTLEQLNTNEAFIHKLVTIGAYDTSLADNMSLVAFATELIAGGTIPEHEALSAITILLALMSGDQLDNNNPSNYIANDGLVPLQSQLLLKLPTTGAAFSFVDANQNVFVDFDRIEAHAPQDMLYRIFSSTDGIADHADVLETTNPAYWSYITSRLRAVLEKIRPTATLVDPSGGQIIDLNVLNNRGYIDVAYHDDGGSTLDPTTILDVAQEITLTGDAAAQVALTGQPTRISDAVYRYTFSGRFAAGFVGVQFAADAFADDAGNGNAAQAAQFLVHDPAAPLPSNAYGISDSGDHLGVIDAVTGEFTVVGQLRSADGLTLFSDIENLAVDPVTGLFYGVNTSTLVTIDPMTAIVTVIGDTGLSDVDALTFNAQGQLFAVDATPATNPGRLFLVDTQTASASLVTDLLMPVPDELVAMGAVDPKLDGIAFDPASGDLIAAYSSWGSQSYMVRVDMTTGQLLNIGAAGVDDIEDIAFGPDGVLYGTLGDTGAVHGDPGGSFEGLVSIDIITGAATPIGLFGTPLNDGRWDMEGFAFFPARITAEPSDNAPAAALSAFSFDGMGGETDLASAGLQTLPADQSPRILTGTSPLPTSESGVHQHAIIGSGGPRTLRYLDADGTRVTVSIRNGQGSLEISGDDVQFNETAKVIEVTGHNLSIELITVTDAAAATISVKTRGGDGRTDIGGIHVEGSARTIKMPGVDLAGDLRVTGFTGRVNIGSIIGDHLVELGGSFDDKPSRLVFGELQDVSVISGAPVSMKVIRWTDTDPLSAPDSLTAPSAVKLVAKGDARNNIIGHWAADVTLTGQGTRGTTLRTFRSQSLSDSVFNIIGAIHKFDVSKGNVDGLTLNLLGDAKNIRLGDVSDSFISAHDVGVIKAALWHGGEIAVDAIKSIRVRGALDATLMIQHDPGAKAFRGFSAIAGLLPGQWLVI